MPASLQSGQAVVGVHRHQLRGVFEVLLKLAELLGRFCNASSTEHASTVIGSGSLFGSIAMMGLPPPSMRTNPDENRAHSTECQHDRKSSARSSVIVSKVKRHGWNALARFQELLASQWSFNPQKCAASSKVNVAFIVCDYRLSRALQKVQPSAAAAPAPATAIPFLRDSLGNFYDCPTVLPWLPMAGDWQHWKDLLSEGWKVATGTGAGFVLGRVSALRKWRQERTAAKGKAKHNATLREYGQLQAETYRELLKQREEFSGSVTSVTVTVEARAALEAAVKAFRQAGDDVAALELEKTARAWELSLAAPNPLEQERKAETRAKLLQHAKTQEVLFKVHLEKGRAMGGAHTKNRTFHIEQAARHAEGAAKAYREADDLVQALQWEQTAKSTIP